ncbi:MAG: 5-(carboxyamino)imidazole ribonucleotide synthase [Verrucomicrobiota bacterium]
MSHRVSSSEVIPPGSVLGILGGGQLGRMLALAARSLGYGVHVFTPEPGSPAGQVADVECVAPYEDLDRVRDFARATDVVTFEFENVPSATSAAAAEVARVRPDGRVLHVTQHRLREKTFLRDHGFPVTPFRPVGSLSELERAVLELGLPAVLKTAAFGYDGKGQQVLRTPADLAPAMAALQGAPAILESMVDFTLELSVVGARTAAGDFAAFPVFQNAHARHILDVTTVPADVPEAVQAAARDLAHGILRSLDVVGLLTVELFLTRDGRLLVNELAPRTHNSGHVTLDACVTSQFEQQVRAICGLPLGDTRLRSPAAMANLLGDVWAAAGGSPRWEAALGFPDVHLHLYGKTDPRPGRKMGHLTALAGTAAEAADLARRARAALAMHTTRESDGTPIRV